MSVIKCDYLYFFIIYMSSCNLSEINYDDLTVIGSELLNKKRELIQEITALNNTISNIDVLIVKYNKELYMRCDHFWTVDWNYSSPHNDKEYVCSKCGQYKDYELEQNKLNLKIGEEKE